MTIHNFPVRGGANNAAQLGGSPYNDFLNHSSGQRVLTEAVEIKSIRAKHPDRALTVVNGFSCDLLGFAAAGQAEAIFSPETSDSVLERQFLIPAKRHGGDEGTFGTNVLFAAFDYVFNGKKFLIYIARCSQSVYSEYVMNFILNDPGSANKPSANGNDPEADALVKAATTWGTESHEEMWVFNQGSWRKDKELYKTVQEANWDDVIMDEEKKKSLIEDVDGFFSSESSYKEFAVPWKRGLIFYGPPGNGKTISIKALMRDASRRKSPTVEALYVKTFNTGYGPEYGVMSIFAKARQLAPCILVFEDIDSLVSPAVRSYFLNAVDGLESNHGILMVASTNHLERLDPGIAKRPSRFDRRYLFALPTRDERIQYAQYWRGRLQDNKKIDFPEPLCAMIADITDDFSFAYMKEAFVATLLALVASRKPAYDDLIQRFHGGDGHRGAEKSVLWREIQKQVKLLRDEMDAEAAKELENIENKLRAPRKRAAVDETVGTVAFDMRQELAEIKQELSGIKYDLKGRF